MAPWPSAPTRRKPNGSIFLPPPTATAVAFPSAMATRKSTNGGAVPCSSTLRRPPAAAPSRPAIRIGSGSRHTLQSAWALEPRLGDSQRHLPPAAANPNVTPTVPSPVSSHPNGVGSWRNGIAASDPHPAAANSNRPVAGHPDVIGPRSHRDYLHLLRRRRLVRNDRLGRSPGLRWHIDNLAFNTSGPQGGNSTRCKYH